MPEIEIETAEAFLDAVESLRADFKRGGKITLSWKCEGSYTPSQRNALHLWCEMLAKVLNDAGLDMKRILKPAVDIPWGKLSVKEFLYKPVLEAMTTKTSTEEMTTVEPDAVCKVVGRHLAEKHGIEVPAWPSRFND